jgi:hypothetical protein
MKGGEIEVGADPEGEIEMVGDGVWLRDKRHTEIQRAVKVVSHRTRVPIPTLARSCVRFRTGSVLLT